MNKIYRIRFLNGKILEVPNLWFTSDTHYGHTNIVRGVSNWNDLSGCRDYNTVEQMNRVIIETINEKIGADDFLIHLGDWSFGGEENIKTFRDQLIVQKILIIKGNHDKKLEKYQNLFWGIERYEEIIVNKSPLISLFHYPIESWHNKEKGGFHLYGHVHRNEGEHHKTEKKLGRFNVCIDANNMNVIHYDEIEKKIKHYFLNHKN